MKKYFEELSNSRQQTADSRQQMKIKYNLAEVVVMAIIAVTAGAEHWNEIALYCKTKQEMLKTRFHLQLENSTSYRDTFQRIFAIIKPKEFEKRFTKWIRSVIKVTDKEIVSLDGETLRGSWNSEGNLNMIHIVSAWRAMQALYWNR